MSEKRISVGKPLPASMLPPPRPVENCLSYWFPRIHEAGLPVPRTVVIRTAVDLLYLLDGETPDGYTGFMDGMLAAAEHIGYPLFLRSGQISGKHHWETMCFVPDADALPRHVTAIVNWSHIVDFVGLPTDVWVLREMIPTQPLFRCDGYGRFPVTREFRFFVRDTEVEHIQPYWPPQAVEDGKPDLDVWRSVLDEISTLAAEEALDLQDLALEACAAVGGGHWSVDFLQDRDGRWWLTDMALGDNSFKWSSGEQEAMTP